MADIKKATNPRIIVVRAAQGIIVDKTAVMNRSLSDSRMRVAMIAGTVHPYPRMMGITAFPWSPILCRNVSIRKAIRGR